MEMEPGSLFLVGMSPDTSEDRLREYFQTFGEVVEAGIKKKRIKGLGRVGFIAFADLAVAERAYKEKHMINGRTVKAKKAVPSVFQHLLNDFIQGSPSHPARSKMIFVEGIASTVTESDFKKYFDQFGTITDVVVKYDLNTQSSMGYGFVTYDSEEAVDQVLLITLHKLNGKIVEVKRAFPEELSPVPTSSHLGGRNYGMNGLSSFLNAYTQEDNPTSVGSHGLRTDGQLNPVTVGTSGHPTCGSSNRGLTVDKDNNDSMMNAVKIEAPTKKLEIVICTDSDSSSSEAEEPDGGPLRSILCLKNRADMKRFEEIEECFILDFDPYDSLDISKLSMSDILDNADAPELSVVAEKGQVACRDYPHSRHLCVKYAFEKTPHESFCEMCYCYICDLAAPCKYWAGEGGHCHATTRREQLFWD